MSYSLGVLVDLTSPVCSAWDGRRGEQDFDFSTSGVPRLYLRCTDLESGIARVRWGLGMVRGWDDTIPLHDSTYSALPVPEHLARIHNSTIGSYHTSPWRMIDADLTSTDYPLLDGVTYYGLLFVMNGAGSFAWLTTDGQVHDSSPPSVYQFRDILDFNAGRDVDFSLNRTHWGAKFRVQDPHTGVANVTLQLVTTSGTGAEVVMDSFEVDVLTLFVLQPVPAAFSPLPPGRRLWTRIITSNKVGLAATYNTDGWKPDITAPLFSALPTDGTDPSVDAEWQKVSGSLSACWEAFDDESQVDHYLISARRAGVGDDPSLLVNWSPVPRSASAGSGIGGGGFPFVAGETCAFTSGFVVEQGATYQVLVRAVNPLGLWTEAITTGVTVDWTSPVVGHVFVGDTASQGFSSDKQTRRTSLVMAWTNVTEPDTPVVSVEVAIGSRPGFDDIVARRSVPGDPDGAVRSGGTFTFSGLDLQDGAGYFVTMWASNIVELEDRRMSSGIWIDGSPPELFELPHIPFVPGYVFPAAFSSQPSFPALVADSSVTVPVNSFVDVHSGITEVSVALYQSEWGEVPTETAGVGIADMLPLGWTATTVVPPTVIDISHGLLTVVFEGLDLVNHTYIWADVNATNGMGLQSRGTSRAEYVSTTALSAGFVNDGALGHHIRQDMDYQPSSTSYSARWNGFTDPRYAIYYRVALGSRPGLNDLRDWEERARNTFVDVLSDFAVPKGTTVFATVEAYNEIGVVVNASSDGMVLGSEAPMVRNVTFINNSPLVSQVLDADTMARYITPGPIVVSWEAFEVQGIATCTARVLAAPGAEEPLLEAVVEGDVRQVEWDVSFAEGTVLHASVTCTNVRERSTTRVAERWGVVETTPPIPGTVWDGDVAQVGDITWRSSRTLADAHWFDFSDPESNVRLVQVCLGTPNDPCSVDDRAVGKASELALTGLSLTEGLTYLWTVTVTTGAGLTTDARSNGWTVDTIAPSTGFVVDSLPTPNQVDADIQSDASFVECSWGDFSDATSGIDHYTVRVGWAPGGDDVAGPVELPASASSHGFHNLASVLGVGGTVYTTVRAVDRAGNHAEVTSNGLLVDDSPPEAPDGAHTIIETLFGSSALPGTADGPTGHDRDVLPVLSTRWAWGDFKDEESTIASYSVLVEDVTDDVPSTVLPWSNVGLRNDFAPSAIGLKHGHTYRLRLRAFNGVGTWTEIVSDGVSFDTTAPVAGTVADGAVHVHGDMSITAAVGTVAAHWSGFHDPESTLSHYVWCVGTAPGRDDVVACHDVGLALSATARFGAPADGNGADGDAPMNVGKLLEGALGAAVAEAAADVGILQADGTLSPAVLAMIPDSNARLPSYFSMVTAVSELGMTVEAYSNGVRVDTHAPLAGMVQDGYDSNEPDVDLQASSSVLSVYWLGFAEYQTSVTRFEVSVGDSPGGSNVVAPLAYPGSATSATLNGLSLTTGTRYFTTVTAVDEGGLTTSVTTDGVLVDATPPELDFIVDFDYRDVSPLDPSAVTRTTARNFTSDGSLVVAWHFVEPESEMQSYTVSVCPSFLSSAQAPCPLPETNVRLTDLIELSQPGLLPGVRYAATVIATNTAGLASTATSAGFYLDDTPPAAGVVTVVDVLLAQAQVAIVDAATENMAEELAAIQQQGSWDFIAAQWTQFVDAESPIVGYRVCVGTSPQAADLVACRDVGLVNLIVMDATSADAYQAFDGESLSLRVDRGNYTTFHVTVIATNEAELETVAVSAAVQVDVSPPVAGQVFDGMTGEDEAFSKHGSDLCVVAEGFYDLETMVDHYELCAGTTAGSCNVKAFTRVPVEGLREAEDLANPDDDPGRSELEAPQPFEVLCLRGLPLSHHEEVYITVNAVNGVGRGTSVTTNGIMVVLNDPPQGSVIDAVIEPDGSVSTSGADVDVYNQRLAVGAVWGGFDGGVAAPAFYEVAVCGAVSGCRNRDNQLSFFANVGLVTSMALAPGQLSDGEEYAWHVRVTDLAGRSSTGVSNGFVIDTSPPTGGIVHVLSYGIASSVVDPAGQPITEVELTDDAAVLMRGLLLVARSEDAQRLWHAGFGPLHVAWNSFGDAESGVNEYTVCVGSTAQDIDDIAGCKTVGADVSRVVFKASDITPSVVAAAAEQAAAAAAALVPPVLPVGFDEDSLIDPETGLLIADEDGAPVRAAFSAIVRVYACNRADHCSVVSAPTMAIDMSPPVAGFVSATLEYDGLNAAYSALVHEWSCRWAEFRDMESGLAFYTVAVVDVDTEEYVLEAMNVGLSRGMSTDELELVTGHRYSTEVTG